MRAIVHALALYVLIDTFSAYSIRLLFSRRVSIGSRQYQISNLACTSSSHSDDYNSILQEQGISWNDLIDMKNEYIDNNKLGRTERYRSIKRVVTQDTTTGTRTAIRDASIDNQNINDSIQGDSMHNTIQSHALISTENTSKSRKVIPTVVPVTVGIPEPSPIRRRKGPSPFSNTNGVTLQAMLEWLVENLGFPVLHAETKLTCFARRPTVASSLKVLRQERMGWARRLVEGVYTMEKQRRMSAYNG